MKKIFGTTVALAILAISISSAQAIIVRSAEVQSGVAVVQGGQVAPNATITWEGGNVTNANLNGRFRFSGAVPSDCVGTLSDGVSTIDVALANCTVSPPTASAPVPQTGQTTSFATGDDGDLEKGVVLPTPRFTDNTNGTITDNLTGLMWLKNANCPGGGRAWATALTDVASLNSVGTMNGNGCGDTSNAGSHQTDWRLPNIRELHSLVDFAFFNPALSNAAGTGHGSGSDPFSNFQTTSFYWSSTTFASLTVFAWGVDFVNGFVDFDAKIDSNFVLAVRGGS